MTENEQSMDEGLTETQLEELSDVCDRHGFPLADAKLENGILQLVPASLEELPDAGVLDAIAGELESEGGRYVTFVVPDAKTDESSA